MNPYNRRTSSDRKTATQVHDAQYQVDMFNRSYTVGTRFWYMHPQRIAPPLDTYTVGGAFLDPATGDPVVYISGINTPVEICYVCLPQTSTCRDRTRQYTDRLPPYTHAALLERLPRVALWQFSLVSGEADLKTSRLVARFDSEEQARRWLSNRGYTYHAGIQFYHEEPIRRDSFGAVVFEIKVAQDAVWNPV